MKKLAIMAAIAAIATGCATKTRNVEIDGLFTQAEAGMLAVGSVDVMATPAGEEGAMVKFAKDYNYFQSQPNYDIKVQMTGTNSVQRLPDVVRAICEAFKEKLGSDSVKVGSDSVKVESDSVKVESDATAKTDGTAETDKTDETKEN